MGQESGAAARVVVVAVGGPLVILLALRGPLGVFAGLVAAAAALALREMFRLCARAAVPALLLPVVAMAWVAPGLTLLVLLHREAAPLAALLVAATWARDLGAFAVGRRLAGPVLWPAASPTKTLTGALGGFLACALAIAAFDRVGRLGLGWAEGATLAGLVGVAGQAGDLVESRLKRLAGARHSGDLLGRQGGVLDAIDGLLFTAPTAGARLLWIVRHGGL